MRKILSVLLAVLLLQLPAGAKVFEDAQGIAATNAISVLSDLDLVQGKSDTAFEPASPLTRAEMTTIIIRLFGMEGMAQGSDIFEDVNPSHWAYANIAAAAKMGIVNGIDETHFAPDAPLTFVQAVKMLVCALGYEVHAASMGGYPAGHLAKAAQLGLLDGVPTNEAITRGAMAQLVYNALDCEILVRVDYGTSYTFVEKAGATLLSEYLGIANLTAQVTATCFATLSAPPRKLANDEVTLDGKIYKVGKSSAASLFGQKITAYVTTDEDTPEIKVIMPHKNSSSILIGASDISAATTTAKLIYTLGDTEYTANIQGAQLVLNGDSKGTAYSAADIIPTTGTVQLISNNNNYDVIIVNTYVNYVVQSVDAEEETVYCKDFGQAERSIKLNGMDGTRRYSLKDTAGKTLSVSNLGEWDVLSIAAGNDTSTVIVSSDVISGTVQEVSGKTCTIDNLTYDIDPALLVAGGSVSKPEIGVSAVFSLNFAGMIVAVDESAVDNSLYGWLAGATAPKGLGGVPMLKIFTQDAEMKIYDVTDYVTYIAADGSEVNVKKENLIDTAGFLSGGTVVNQLLRYRVNEDGRITEIHAAQDFCERLNDDARLHCFAKVMDLDYQQKDTSGTKEYIRYVAGSLHSFKTNLVIVPTTVTFIINADEKSWTISKGTGNYSYDAQGFKCYSLYDALEDGTVRVAVWEKGRAEEEAGIGSGTANYDLVSGINTGIVTRQYVGMDAEGETITSLSIMTQTGAIVEVGVDSDFKIAYGFVNCDPKVEAAKTYYDNEGNHCGLMLAANGQRDMPNSYINVKEIHVGDAVAFATNAAGRATALHVLYRADNPGFTEIALRESNYKLANNLITANDIYTGQRFSASAIVDKMFDTTIACTTHISDAAGMASTVGVYHRLYPCTFNTVLLIDMKNETVKMIDKAAIKQNDRLFTAFGFVGAKFNQNLLAVYRNF